MSKGYRLSFYAVIAFCVLGFGTEQCQAQSVADLDILGVHLGASRAEASATLHQKFPDATFTDITGALTFGQFKSPATTFGTQITFNNSNDPFSYIHLTYDMHDQSTVIAMSRYQLFRPGGMPSVEQTAAALTAKFGKPRFANGAAQANTAIHLVWYFGAAPDMVGKMPLLSPCLSFMRNAADSLSSGQGVGRSSGDQNLPKCGVWAEAMISTWNDNPAMVANLEMEIGDLPRAKASIDAVMDSLAKGDAAIRSKGVENALKPPL